MEELGDIHLLVNNAGIAEQEAALEATPENFDRYDFTNSNDTDFLMDIHIIPIPMIRFVLY